jgi:predicted nucleic acid-binding protein
MILVDTSVWIEHLRWGSPRLRSLLYDDEVVCHPFVVGELACGMLRNREEILGKLRTLPEARVADQNEVLRFLETHRLYGRGLGWVDAHILASALLTGCTLWTLDQALRRAAAGLGIALQRDHNSLRQ